MILCACRTRCIVLGSLGQLDCSWITVDCSPRRDERQHHAESPVGGRRLGTANALHDHQYQSRVSDLVRLTTMAPISSTDMRVVLSQGMPCERNRASAWAISRWQVAAVL